MENFVKSLSKIKRPKISEIGGKGYSLVLLIKHGFNVPKGFVITSKAFLEFLRHNGLAKIRELTLKINGRNLKEKSKTLRNFILKGKIPEKIVKEIANELKKYTKLVAVRSSGVNEDSITSSFAGLHETFLNVKPSLDHVLEKIKGCWASLFNERALFYCIKKGLPLESMAVIVQTMIPAEISGVSFTVAPTRKDALLIECGRGLGDRIVSGEVIPNTFIVDRKSLNILKKEINEPNPPPDVLIKEIAQLCLKVEALLGYPQDIEWCTFKNRIWLLQSRAITSLK